MRGAFESGFAEQRCSGVAPFIRHKEPCLALCILTCGPCWIGDCSEGHGCSCGPVSLLALVLLLMLLLLSLLHSH